MHFASISRFNFHVIDLFLSSLVSLRSSVFCCLPQWENNFLTHPSNTEPNQPLFLVSFDPVLWILLKSLQFSTFPNVSTLMKYVLLQLVTYHTLKNLFRILIYGITSPFCTPLFLYYLIVNHNICLYLYQYRTYRMILYIQTHPKCLSNSSSSVSITSPIF